MSQSPFSEAINQLKPKQKEPRSARVLDGWIAQAQHSIGGEFSGGRLGWLIASTVVVAAPQRAVDEAPVRCSFSKAGRSSSTALALTHAQLATLTASSVVT